MFARLLLIVLALLLSCANVWAQQVPADLRKAMDERSRAIARSDATTWDRLTADEFTVVRDTGILQSKAERLAEIRRTPPSNNSPTPDTYEQIRLYGDIAVARTRGGSTWVLQVWRKQAAGWRVVATQLTDVAPARSNR